MTTFQSDRVGFVSLLALMAVSLWMPTEVRAFQDAAVELAQPGSTDGGDAVVDGARDSDAAATDDAGADTDEASPSPAPRFERPEHIRGLYANAWAAGSRGRMSELIDLARRTEINAFVIDIKDATGYISHHTEVPLAHEIGATEEPRIADLPGLLDRLQDAGIYPIARIVIVRDPIVSKYRPEMAIQDTAGGVWVDGKGLVWLNPYSKKVWDYHVAIAREVAELGFPEIQFDYVRFPDAPEEDLARAVFVGQDERPKSAVIRQFLQYARAQLGPLGVQTTADVFGVTTSANRDVGIGQVWETFIDAVDVALPMVYPSHYWEGSFGYDVPNERPYEVVRRAVSDARRRSAAVEGAGIVRPWLQDFTLGQPVYAGAEVRAQIQAVYDAGGDEWVLWNPGSNYTEAALEPVGGFDREPLVRVGGLLTPVSRRYIVMDSIASVAVSTDGVAAEQADTPSSAFPD